MILGLPEELTKAFQAFKEKPGDETTQKAFFAAVEKADTDAKAAAEKSKPPEKYKFELPEGGVTTQEDLDNLADRAKKLGVNQEVANSMLKFEHETRMQTVQRLADQSKTHAMGWMKELETKHGDKLKDVLHKSKTFSKYFVPKEILADMESTGRGNEPWLVEMAAKLHDELGMGEGYVPKGEQTGSGDKPSEAKEWGVEIPDEAK